jgi:hypothetical protein
VKRKAKAVNELTPRQERIYIFWAAVACGVTLGSLGTMLVLFFLGLKA